MLQEKKKVMQPKVKNIDERNIIVRAKTCVGPLKTRLILVLEVMQIVNL